MGSSSSNLALLTGSELSKISVVVSLPGVVCQMFCPENSLFTYILW